ncbi:probable low-specificity L-threonine aldolase 2 [Selaginella moellendorffii]|uniref:probable low-specificity L-threonine aldolase 2 n=1 Tax=Selaginella moellendorffii TaxID=88036 RepID=UPI000D1C8930|nr:probable low-specificity L-threonine aldolase 2 [Selaginella moellendorffii]|eukprot:XP_002975719.2 probable low-specificity L-threonine aldolase 2 [Selaginella moellendorffii]
MDCGANGTKRIVDFRSDTITKPTAAMRAAMASAEVDDDIVTVDPTMDELQKEMARIFGKEAALFVPSGTMGNLISVLVHCEARASEAIIGSESHINVYEQGGMATLGGVFPSIVPNNPDGTMDLRAVENAIKPLDDEHFATTRLICIENTHNRCGGRCVSVEYTDQVGQLAKRYGLRLHVDGARIFNASTALGVSPERLVRAADTVSVCLSKGLAAPAGSVIVGSHEFIEKAKRLRKALGGAMRQVGILAAPGLVALKDMVCRLYEDHSNARLLAEGLCGMKGLQVDMSAVETNIVNVDVTKSRFTAEELCRAMGKIGILSYDLTKTSIRLVTHYHISEDDVRYTLACFQRVLADENGRHVP